MKNYTVAVWGIMCHVSASRNIYKTKPYIVFKIYTRHFSNFDFFLNLGPHNRGKRTFNFYNGNISKKVYFCFDFNKNRDCIEASIKSR